MGFDTLYLIGLREGPSLTPLAKGPSLTYLRDVVLDVANRAAELAQTSKL